MDHREAGDPHLQHRGNARAQGEDPNMLSDYSLSSAISKPKPGAVYSLSESQSLADSSHEAEGKVVKKRVVPNKKRVARNGTEIVGTKRYNPFMFGSMGSKFSSLGSSMNSRRRLRKAEKGEPYELFLVKGWFKVMKRSEANDLESIADIERNKGKGKFGDLFKLSKSADMKVDGGATLSKAQINTLNRIARSRRMEDLSPEEITKIEKRMEEERPGEKVGCFSFMKSTWRMIMSDREKDTEGRPRKTSSRSRTKRSKRSRKGTDGSDNDTRECIMCGFTLKPDEELGKKDDNYDGEPLSLGCVTCELSRVRVSKAEAIRLRELGQACLSPEAREEVDAIKEAQKRLNASDKKSNDEYPKLFPRRYNLFLPVSAISLNGRPGQGMIAMCFSTGLQIRKDDAVFVDDEGERMLTKQPSKEEAIVRFRNDLRTAAVGFEDVIYLTVSGNNSLLKKPLELQCTFKKDMSSLQFELEDGVKDTIPIIYHVSNDVSSITLDLDQFRLDALFFTATLSDEFGPFVEGHTFLKQEKDSRLTGNKVILEGRFSHGLLYNWEMTLVANTKTNTVAPVSLILTLSVPQ